MDDAASKALSALIVNVVVSASGKLLDRVVQVFQGKPDPLLEAQTVMAKTFGTLASGVSPNSLRLLVVLRHERSAIGLNHLLQLAADMAAEQEGYGDPFENNIRYRMRFLETLGLVTTIGGGGGGDFALTYLGIAFIDKAEQDTLRYGRVFAPTRPR
jgi:hypothetical protein